MPSASLTRRLLRKISFAELKSINNHFDLLPRKSKDEMITQILRKTGTNLQALVSKNGPFTLAEWNQTAIELGGVPRKSFEAIFFEIKRYLDPIFDKLDGYDSIADLRKSEPQLRKLAGNLCIDRKELDARLVKTHGATLLANFVTEFRKTQALPPKAKKSKQTSMVRVASTRVMANLVEKLDTKWMKDFVAGAEQIDIAAGFYHVDFLKKLFFNQHSVKRVRLLFNGLGGQRLKQQIKELQDLETKLILKHIFVEIRLAFCPSLFHSKLFLAKEKNMTRGLVGSANATEAAFDQRNEEVLVALSDAGALVGYFESAWSTAKPLGEQNTTARTLVTFFRTGSLYFKPVNQLTKTFNPFSELLSQLPQEDLASLGTPKFPNAVQESGIGAFNLMFASLGEQKSDKKATDDISSENPAPSKISAAKLKPYSIETCYGYWVPCALDSICSEKLNNSSKQQKSKLNLFSTALNAMQDDELNKKYQDYLQAVSKELGKIPNIGKK